jgi:hypothetical protein
MGEKAMSDVEERIEQWRANLTQSEAVTDADAIELESHLREEIKHLEGSGLSGEEAFLLGRHRLGDAAALDEEFAKVNGPRRLANRLWWMIAGVLAYLVATHFAGTASVASLAIAQNTDLSPRVLGIIGVAVRIGAFCVLGVLVLLLCIRYSRPGGRSPIHISRRARMALLLALLVETLAFTITRVCGVLSVTRTMAPQDYAQVVVVESFGVAAWRLAGPVLLGALLIVIHLAGRQKTETQ